MLHVQLPDHTVRRLSFYLAMEEYVAQEMMSDEAFFMWQVEPSVIFGLNQVVENEVNIPYCRQHGIQMYRRKSGGGCVYADMSNVMLSYICSDTNVDATFARYMTMFAEALCRLGFPAQKNDHNDIMIDNRKVSGNAIYHLPHRNIAHGTLLYDTNMEHMLNAITPPHEKLSKHGVESVRQRICLLSEYTDRPFADIIQALQDLLCTSTRILTDADISQIEEIEKEYLDPAFIFRK